MRMDFPRGSDGKESACNTEDPSSIPRLVRSLKKGIKRRHSLQSHNLKQPETVKKTSDIVFYVLAPGVSKPVETFQLIISELQIFSS